MLFQIKDLLQKFKDLQDPQQIRAQIARIFNEQTKTKAFSFTSFEIKKHIIWLKVHPALKQKVFMMKQKCIERVNAEFPDQNIVDIR